MKKTGYTFPLLSDPNAETIRRYDLVHKGESPGGHDIARPAGWVASARVLILTGEQFW